LNNRSRRVVNSAFASSSVFGMASRTASTSQYALCRRLPNAYYVAVRIMSRIC
jgi:hypothetical protein